MQKKSLSGLARFMLLFHFTMYAYSCCGNSAPPLPACVPSRVRVGWRSLFPVALWLIRAVVVTIYRS